MNPLMQVILVGIAAIHPWNAAPLDAKQVFCMAKMGWDESRGSFNDLPFVMFIALHRSREQNRSICEIVGARGQFVGYAKTPVPGPEWNDAVEVAVFVMTGMLVDVTGNATYFIDAKKHPAWARDMREIGHTEHHRYLALSERASMGARE